MSFSYYVYKYEIYRSDSDEKELEFTYRVDDGDNILKVGYEYLKAVLNLGNVPMYRVYDMVTITSICKVVPEICEGCINNSLGQDAHMDCPTGCLHNPQNCEYCSI